MLEGTLIQLAILFGAIATSFILGYFKGKNHARINQLKINVKDTIETKRRRKKRSSDDINVVKHRMRKYTSG